MQRKNNPPIDPAGFRTTEDDAAGAPRFSAIVSVFVAVWEGAKEVRRAVGTRGFFFSSPEPPTEDWDLCDALVDVEAVALLAGFRTVELATGRVGGLLKLPVVLVEDEADAAVGLAAVEEAAGPI